jgi:hypothetical protein
MFLIFESSLSLVTYPESVDMPAVAGLSIIISPIYESCQISSFVSLSTTTLFIVVLCSTEEIPNSNSD